MEPEKWQRIKHVFGAALEQEPDSRAAFLELSCGGDAELRAEVESLLAFHCDDSTMPPSPDPLLQPKGLLTDSEAVPGCRIGPYRLVREIGRGGMALVHLAVRDDDQYHKRVAIKFVRRGIDDDDMVRRFRNERQTLAALDHPNIVKLLDGGSTEEGTPWLAMEYVEGLPVDEYCDAHRLTITERLRLFCTICAAVQYAHQNLVIHRDLKPSNILITAEGVPKLLDFGIAKLLNPEVSAQTLLLTEPNAWVLTPEYASPEQVRGSTITTATDVYSLGVILYYMLSGCPPYRWRTRTPLEIGKAICEDEPEKPSTAIVRAERPASGEGAAGSAEVVSRTREGSPEKLRRRLAGDLDNIVLKALRKEPERRYQSVLQLSDDIRRHIDGLPVTAHRASFTYRTSKFVRRNKGAFAAGVLIVVALVVATAVTGWEAHVANQQRILAESRFSDVRQLADSFLFDFDDAIKNLRGSTPARELIVQKALEYLNRLKAESEGNASLQMDLVRAYLKVGDIQGSPYTANLGDLRGALETYKRGQQIALALFRSHPDDHNVQLLLAKTYGNIGAAQVFAGRPQDAITNLNRAVELLRPITSSSGAGVDAVLDLLNSYTELGDAYGHGSVVNLGQPRKALEFFQQALTLGQTALISHPGNASLHEHIAVAETKIGDVLLGERELNGAVEYHRNALKEFTAIASSEPENARAKREVCVAEDRLARSLWERGDRKKAVELDRKAQLIAEDLYSADPANMQAKFDLAVGLRNLSQELSATHSFAEAVDYFRRAIELVSDLAAADPTNVERQAQLGEGLVSFGHLLRQVGRQEEALRRTGRGLEVERSLAASKMATADQKLTYAYALLTCDPEQLRNPAESLEFARQAEKMDPNDPDVLNVLASADFALGNVHQAAETEGHALTLIGQHSNADSFFSAKEIRDNLTKFEKVLNTSGRSKVE